MTRLILKLRLWLSSSKRKGVVFPIVNSLDDLCAYLKNIKFRTELFWLKPFSFKSLKKAVYSYNEICILAAELLSQLKYSEVYIITLIGTLFLDNHQIVAFRNGRTWGIVDIKQVFITNEKVIQKIILSYLRLFKKPRCWQIISYPSFKEVSYAIY